jgi:peptide/nickel transport system permease protein
MLFLAVVVAAPSLFATQSPLALNVDQSLDAPSAAHPFGTDDVGRDVLARVAFGARTTLSICAGALLMSAALGGSLGLLCGFLGGWVDMALSRLVDVVLSFPPIILGVMVTGILGPETANLVLALAVVYLPVFFRIARSGAMAEAGLTYVEAARSIGLSEGTILARHVGRNVLPLVLVQYVVLFPLVLQIQAALGFLGLGVQPPTAEWGAMLASARDYIDNAWWIVTFPGLSIVISVLAVNLLGDGLRDALDPKLKRMG